MKLSIIIAAWNGAELLRKCLSSLQNQLEASKSEAIVISNFEAGINKLKTEFPNISFIILPPQTTVPRLWLRGINQTTGSIVAFSEDVGKFSENWCREIIKSHQLDYAVIGGPVENINNQSSLDWAVYFYDYGKYMLPGKEQITDTLSGLNVSYKRKILEQEKENYSKGFYEAFINASLKRQGHNLYLIPSAVVYHQKKYHFQRTVKLFFHQGRSYAAQRTSNLNIVKKILIVPFSLVLPILLPLRIILKTVKKGRHLSQLLIAVPYLILITGIWSFGEFCGYLIGEGKSSDNWK